MFQWLTTPQLVAVTATAAVGLVVALLWLWHEYKRPGRKGETVELRYGWFVRIEDFDNYGDGDCPF